MSDPDPASEGTRLVTGLSGFPALSQQGAAPLGPGIVVNNTYRLEAMVARGGMGEVYRATNLVTGEACAIKTMRPEIASDSRITELFKREAAALRKVRNPGVVSYEGVFSDASGNLFLAMEWLDGPTLVETIAAGPLPPDEVRNLRRRLAAGLAAAHAEGVIHRDLSPDNVILPGGRLEGAKLIDFGIARQEDLADRTMVGDSLAGKLRYMAPEQLGLAGGKVDGRADIYSLGLVLAALAGGKPLQMGTTPGAALEARRKVPDLQHLPAELRAELGRMLEPDPAKRPQSMVELALAPPTKPVAQQRSKAGTLALAAAAAVAVLGGVGFLALRGSDQGAAPVVASDAAAGRIQVPGPPASVPEPVPAATVGAPSGPSGSGAPSGPATPNRTDDSRASPAVAPAPVVEFAPAPAAPREPVPPQGPIASLPAAPSPAVPLPTVLSQAEPDRLGSSPSGPATAPPAGPTAAAASPPASVPPAAATDREPIAPLPPLAEPEPALPLPAEASGPTLPPAAPASPAQAPPAPTPPVPTPPAQAQPAQAQPAQAQPSPEPPRTLSGTAEPPVVVGLAAPPAPGAAPGAIPHDAPAAAPPEPARQTVSPVVVPVAPSPAVPPRAAPAPDASTRDAEATAPPPQAAEPSPAPPPPGPLALARPPEPPPTPEQRREAIAFDLRRTFAAEPCGRVGVQVGSEFQVVLDGWVETDSRRRSVIAAAASAPGVGRVVGNRLRIVPRPYCEVLSTLDGSELDGFRITPNRADARYRLEVDPFTLEVGTPRDRGGFLHLVLISGDGQAYFPDGFVGAAVAPNGKRTWPPRGAARLSAPAGQLLAVVLLAPHPLFRQPPGGSEATDAAIARIEAALRQEQVSSAWVLVESVP